MKTFTQLASVAALAAYANAVCPLFPSAAADSCTDFPEMQTAVVDHAGDYTWRFYNTKTQDDYKLKLMRFEADANGDQVADQWTQGPVLLMHSVTQDCRDWLVESADAATDSIPKQLFDAGYDVWLGCTRGTIYSNTHETLDNDSEEYWDFNTETIGNQDVPVMVAKILQETRTDDIVQTCNKVQILAHSIGSAEALVTLSSYPTSSERLVSQLVNLSPCPIPTYQFLQSAGQLSSDSGSSTRHSHDDETVLDQKQERDDLRKLHEHGNDDFWARVDNYCSRYPSRCAEQFCDDWYPQACSEFCHRYPDLCIPSAITEQYTLEKAFEDEGIYSRYNDMTWADDVDTLCNSGDISYFQCSILRQTVGSDRKETSVQQLEHMWQIGYKRQFNSYSSDFEMSYGQDQSPIPVENIAVPVNNILVKDNTICDPSVNEALLDSIPNSDWVVRLTNDEVDHSNIWQANDKTYIVDLIKLMLKQGSNQEVDTCTNLYVWQ